MMDFLLQAFITMFVIINPFAAVPLFVSLTKHDSDQTKNFVARRCCLISVTLLLVFAVIGDSLMKFMHISEAAFRITGGFLLLLSAIEMVRAKSTAAPTGSSDCTTRIDDICVFPLAIPFLAGPGAITSTVILMRQASEISVSAQIGLLGVLISMMIITYICLILSNRLLKIIGITGTNILTRVFGIVICALSIQGIINGVVSIMKHS